MLKQHSRLFSTALIVGDFTLTIAAFITAFWLRFHSGLFSAQTIPDFESYYIVALVAGPLCLVMFSFAGVYQPRRIESIFSDVLPILGATVGVMIALSAFTFYYREVSFSRLTFLVFGVVFFLFTATERVLIRVALRSLRRRGFNVKRLLVVGAGHLGLRVVKAANNNLSYGYKVVGLLDDNVTNGYFKSDYGVDVLGRTRELPRVVEQYNVDKVIIALPARAYDKTCRIVERCEREGIEAEIVPDFFKIIQPSTRVRELEGLPIVSVRHLPTESWGYTVMKRGFDIAFAATVMVLGAPVFLAIAAGIKLTSPGPVFFNQIRVGANRRKFKMYKFRTMRVAPTTESDVTWTTQDDNRRTAFGTFLRRTSLDELPQFWNVLKGDMSIVGPRPERPYFAQQFKDEVPKYMVRHQVKTGITGWAQVNGWRGDTSIKKRIEYDLFYLENWSFKFDLKIIWLTILRGLINKNAY